MTEKEIIVATAEYVKSQLSDAEGGHDWWHIYRVWQNAIHISDEENSYKKCADRFIIELAALLHDIADPKFHDGDEELGPSKAKEFLSSFNIPSEKINHIINIIRHMSFKNSFEATSFSSIEMEIVQDADRLDAIGAIGIARAFNYGGFKNRALYNPDIPPDINLTKEKYKMSEAPTLNHFYEKLLLLKDRMNTTTGKTSARHRHQYMVEYLEQFYKEWNAEL